MQINSNDLKFLVGDFEILKNIMSVPVLSTFSDYAMDFLAALSKEILSDKRSKNNVDVISYAYWIRKASLEEAKQKHNDFKNRLGRGVAFHIAPSNVPVNFAVSMTSSILAGNISIIRVSDKEFEQVDIICDAMNRLFCGRFENMKKYFIIVRYAHNDIITKELSSICDLRIIWGGNRTIEAIRKAEIPHRAIEMTFADRHSIAIINSDFYLLQDKKKIAKGFYTDTYYTDQNACSSPRLVVWTGNNVIEARKQFWECLYEIVENDYTMKPIQAVDKYSSFCNFAMSRKGVKLISDNNYVMRCEVDKIYDDMMNFKNGGGYFFEFVTNELEDIVPVLSKQCQTVSVLGIDKQDVMDIVVKYGVRGVDRIVPLGETMGLEFIWDGYKMIESMSRYVYMGNYF